MTHLTFYEPVLCHTLPISLEAGEKTLEDLLIWKSSLELHCDNCGKNTVWSETRKFHRSHLPSYLVFHLLRTDSVNLTKITVSSQII
jgi:hypothetical protein